LGRGVWKWAETGRFAPKPGINDIRYDKLDRPMDDKGRRLPRGAIRADILEPDPVSRRKRRVEAPELAPKSAKTDEDYRSPKWSTTQAPEIERDKITNYSHGNRSNGWDVDTVFLEAFANHVAKGPFEPGDVNIFRYGTQIRMNKRLSTSNRRSIREYLGKFEGVSVRFIREDRVDTFQIVFGSNTIPSLVRDVFMDLKQKRRVITGLLDFFDEEGWYYDWYAFFDTEDDLYDVAA
jgi:hypothetical protein